MMSIIPTYIVTWEQPVGTHTHEMSLRVSQDRLEQFLGVLMFNGVNSFGARLDT